MLNFRANKVFSQCKGGIFSSLPLLATIFLPWESPVLRSRAEWWPGPQPLCRDQQPDCGGTVHNGTLRDQIRMCDMSCSNLNNSLSLLTFYIWLTDCWLTFTCWRLCTYLRIIISSLPVTVVVLYSCFCRPQIIRQWFLKVLFSSVGHNVWSLD